MWRILMFWRNGPIGYVFCNQCVFFFDVRPERKHELCRAPSNYQQVRTHRQMQNGLAKTPDEKNYNNKCKSFRQSK